MSLLSRLRGRAINARTRAQRAYWLKSYLRNKARLGLWDDRFLNGHPGNVNTNVRYAIKRAVAAGLVVTSTTDGTHAPGSMHYAGDAADFGLAAGEVGTTRGLAKLTTFQRKEHWRHRKGRLPRMVELIGPYNHLAVLKASETDLAEGSPLETQHDNHVHEGYR